MIQSEIQASIAVKQAILNDPALLAQIEELANTCVLTFQKGGKVITAGNGGSFADAQHISAEFTSRFMYDRPSLPSIALGCNSSAISAIGNDYGYDQAFSRELSSIGTKGDLFIPITTSGNSPNILAAIEVAKQRNLTIIGLTGQSGGKMAAQIPCIQVPSTETPRIQEAHILIGHIICAQAERIIFPN